MKTGFERLLSRSKHATKVDEISKTKKSPSVRKRLFYREHYMKMKKFTPLLLQYKHTLKPVGYENFVVRRRFSVV